MKTMIVKKDLLKMAVFVVILAVLFVGCNRDKFNPDRLLQEYLKAAEMTQEEYKAFLDENGITDKEFKEFLVAIAKEDNGPDDDSDAELEKWMETLPSNTGDFQAERLDGSKVGKEIFANHKLTMMNVWATWCGPCLSEMPDLEKVAKAREKDGIQLIGVIIDAVDESGNRDNEKIELVRTILQKTGVTYQIIQPDKALNEKLLNGIQAVPTTFFVGPDGQLMGKPEVGSRSESSWNKVITERLAAL